MCFVAWPLDDREAGGNFALIEPPSFSYVGDAIPKLISRNFTITKAVRFVSYFETRSPLVSLSFKGQVTKHTTVKRSGPSCSNDG